MNRGSVIRKEKSYRALTTETNPINSTADAMRRGLTPGPEFD